ncbi:MAG: hypothetical protein K0U37_02225 [Gammaproteobacteria bacterium]|nr:hypothetical protein [Gammaproteobacteria bacterium]
MKKFEDLQRGIIQIILDYHAQKTKSPLQDNITLLPHTTEVELGEETDDEELSQKIAEATNDIEPATNSWVRIGDGLTATPNLSLIDTLLTLEPTERNIRLDIYIAEATQTNNTRGPLLHRLKEILAVIDQAIDSHANKATTDTYHQQLIQFLMELQTTLPSSGIAKQAILKFLTALNIDSHTTSKTISDKLQLFFQEKYINDMKTKNLELERDIQRKESEIADLSKTNEELLTQNEALRRVTSHMHQPQTHFLDRFRHILTSTDNNAYQSYTDATDSKAPCEQQHMERK